MDKYALPGLVSSFGTHFIPTSHPCQRDAIRPESDGGKARDDAQRCIPKSLSQRRHGWNEF